MARDYNAFWKMDLINKLQYAIELPLWLVRRFSIPLVEEEYWSRQIVSFSLIPGVLLFAFNCTGGDLNTPISSEIAVPVWVLALVVGVAVAVPTYCEFVGTGSGRLFCSLLLLTSCLRMHIYMLVGSEPCRPD